MKKQQKKNNPFKVNHVRSIKIKAKAQAVKGQLKKLKDIVNRKINTADEELKDLVEVVRQPKVDETAVEVPKKPDSLATNAQRIESYKLAEQNAEEALNRLENWSCDK